MFEIMIGKASGLLAMDIALKNGRSNPTIKDRCQAAMITISPLLLVIEILMMAKFFPSIEKQLDLFLDDRFRFFYLNISLFIIGLGCIFASFRFILTKLPFFLTTMIFIILTTAFVIVIVHGIIHV